jgi:ketosteroid isomerase-like protein
MTDAGVFAYRTATFGDLRELRALVAMSIRKLIAVYLRTARLPCKKGRLHMQEFRDLLLRTYAAFNARDLDGALAAMHPEVEWPNGMEGGYVHGRSGIREYWTRQWGLIDSSVEPTHVEPDGTGRIVVDVHQTVRDLSGKVLADQMVQHVYSLQDGLIKYMEIRK